MRSTEAPTIDWKQRIIEDYSIPPAIFSHPVWSSYNFDFEGMHRRLRNADTIVNEAGRSTWSLNNWLLFSGHLEAVRRGLQSGQIKAETKDESGNLPIHWAACSCNKEVLLLLLEKNPEHASAKNNDGWLPIHCAARSGHTEMLPLLLNENPEHASAKTNAGTLPIHFAVQSGNNKMVALLLNKNPGHTSVKNNDGWLPIHCAARSGHTEMLPLLLEKNPEHASAKTNAGALPIHFAAQSGNNKMVALLLNKNPGHTSAKTNAGALPIHFAAQSGNNETVALLLNENPEHTSAKNDDGDLPIHWAVWSGKKDLVLSLILQHGQDPFAKSTVGLELRDFAEASKNAECLAFCSDLEALAQAYASYFVQQFSQAPEIAARKKLIEKILDTDGRVIPHVAQNLKDDFYKTLADDVFKAQEGWEKAYELLVKCAATQSPLAVQTLAASTLDRVNRLCRGINAKRNLESALKELIELSSRMQEDPFKNCCIQAFNTASAFLSGHFKNECETLLNALIQNPKNDVALKKLNELAKTRAEALICLGRFEEHKARSTWSPAKHYQVAQNYYQHAAEKGPAEAYYWLGLLHENGLGMQKDAEAALCFYYQASQQFPEAKIKLKQYSHCENPKYAALANLFESFTQELIGVPENCYGNYYLQKAFETDSKYCLSYIQKLLNPAGFLLKMPLALEISLPLAQFLECHSRDSENLTRFLDEFFTNEITPDKAHVILKLVKSKFLAHHALNFFNDSRIPYEKRLLAMAFAKNSLDRESARDEKFEEAYRRIEKDLLARKEAIDKIIPPLPSAPPLALMQTTEAQKSLESPPARREKTFSERLEAIQFPHDQIPEKFLCPIMGTLMNKPVYIPSGQIIDAEAYQNILKQNGRDPFDSNLTLSETVPNAVLIFKSEIEEFVAEQEKLAKEKPLSIKNNNNETEKLEEKISTPEPQAEKMHEENQAEKSPVTKLKSQAPSPTLFKRVNSQDSEALADLLPEAPKGKLEERLEKSTQRTLSSPLAPGGV